MDGFAELLYKPAHVITAPITYVSHATRLLAEELLIWNLTSSLWIWIEIIINMESINIISAYNIHSHLANIVSCSLQPRVQQRQLAILKTEIRTPLHDILRRNLLIGSYAMLGTIRINPGMKLHATIMTLLYHPLQRIPIRRRSLTLYARKKLAPRLQIALIQSITLGTNLKDNRIYAILLQFIQLSCKHRLNLLCTLAQILSVNTLYPSSTKLSFVLSHQRCR